MTTLTRFGGMLFQASAMVPEGMQLLWNNGAPVYAGKLGEPIEDAVCDEIWLHPDDYNRLKQRVAS